MKISARLAALALGLVAFPGFAADDAPLVSLRVGETFDLCASGTVVCPANSPICDDLAIATQREGKKGLQIVGVKPGTTTCSARSVNGLRQVFRVTVT